MRSSIKLGQGAGESGGCHALAVGNAVTVRPPAYSHGRPGYSDWLEAKVSLAGLETVHSRAITHSLKSSVQASQGRISSKIRKLNKEQFKGYILNQLFKTYCLFLGIIEIFYYKKE